MNKKKRLIISIIIILLIVALVGAATYAFLVATTNEGDVDTGSGMLDIDYTAPDDIGGTLMLSLDKSTGIKATATAKLNTGSQLASFNLYITPTALTNLNIEALKWEAEAIRNGEVVCVNSSKSGNFSTAEVGTAIKVIDGCELDFTDTTFNIYIWLDASLVNTSIGGATFGATIGADSVPITGEY